MKYTSSVPRLKIEQPMILISSVKPIGAQCEGGIMDYVVHTGPFLLRRPEFLGE